MERWYFSCDGETFGPVTLAELQQLADEGTLEPGDLVWSAGMADWQPAFRVPAVRFPEMPPPLPVSSAIHRAIGLSREVVVHRTLAWLWKHKPVFFFAGFAVCGGIAWVLAAMRMPMFCIAIVKIPFLLCLGGFALTGLVAICKLCSQSQRRTWLRKKWVAANGDGRWLQFSKDGGFVRSDGFGAKYQFDAANDRIVLHPADGSARREIRVVLLSDRDLAITWDDKTEYYEKPRWWKRLLG